ncbi:MAG: tRNA-intron lyase [Thermoproteota archaeon]|nr:MAG: tRNA-intron lyase [Candidatus Korarchaeota archaeon]
MINMMRREDGRIILTGKLAKELYLEGYGELLKDGLELDPVELASLIQRGTIKAPLRDALEALAGDPSLFVKYIVYSDLRNRGRVVVNERSTPFLRLYPEGARIGETSSKILVLPLQEDDILRHGEIIKSLSTAGKLRKELLLAIVDDRLDVVYYEAKLFNPKRVRDEKILPKAEGTLIHDRVIIWDEDIGGELYRRGFWGHPLGIRKPQINEKFKAKLQLNLMESIYLMKKGFLTVKTPDGREIDENYLLDLAMRIKGDVRQRFSVFSYWRDLGYVVKPAQKYGANFMLYEKGPGLEHAPYLCIVSSYDDRIAPVDLIRVGRIATSVRKELVISVLKGDKIVNYKISWMKI